MINSISMNRNHASKMVIHKTASFRWICTAVRRLNQQTVDDFFNSNSAKQIIKSSQAIHFKIMIFYIRKITIETLADFKNVPEQKRATSLEKALIGLKHVERTFKM